MKLKLFLKLWAIYALCCFPLFYFVYKYGTPDLGLKDFYDYYKLYSNWDIDHVEAPFNMRIVSTFFVYLMNKAGFHYETAIAFDSIGLSKQVFFNAVFFNYLCVVTTCTVLFFTIKKHFSDLLLSFTSGLIYLFGFGTLFYELMPITDAFSILVFSLVFYHYLNKSYLIILPLIVLILQREYIFLALGLIALMDLWKTKEKYYLHTLVICILCFASYFILRKTLFYTPKYDHQASPAYFLESIVQIRFPLIPYIKQTLMTLNIYLIYLLVYIYKKYKKLEADSFLFYKLLFLFLQINIISFAAVFGNNTGRYFYILVPVVIFGLVKESKLFLKNE